LQNPSSIATDWYRALTLEERARASRPLEATAEPGEIARLRLARWQRQSPFDQDGWLARRLALDGLDEDGLLRLLDESAESLRDRTGAEPGWMRQIETAFSTPLAATGSLFSQAAPETEAPRAFLEAIRPLAERARQRLAEAAREIAASGDAPFDPAQAVPLLWPAVEGTLLAMLARTLVLELHVARVKSRLSGETPEERFQSFARSLQDPAFSLGLLREYPVLARQAVTTLDHWAEAGREFLAHLQADAPALRATFSPEGALGKLASLEGGGDVHRGGRAVLIANFSSRLKLVYKPRPLATDVHFQELLGWIDARSGLPPLRTLRVLDRGDHGWVEFVEAGPCSSEEEVRRFHLRLGGLLALFYALEATDFHFENLIAAGEHPVPVDLECLFHPRARPAGGVQPDLALVGSVLGRSVVRTGLLPFRMEAGEDADVVDISGLAAVEGEMTPGTVLQWDKPGTDEMVAVRRRMPMTGGSNRPRLAHDQGNREVDTLEHAGSLVEGFTAMYRFLARHREELSGRLDRFADDPVRAVLRATRGYHLLWFESFHPDMLRDALDRDAFLDRLWVGLDEHQHLIPALSFERHDLEEGDIPAFDSRPGSADLWSSRGERIPAYFEEPALTAVRRKLARLGEDDLKLQTWLVRSSVSTLVLKREVVPWPSYEPEEPPEEVSLEDLRARLLDRAHAAGERLADLALRRDGRATWMGVEFHQQRWSLVPLGEDLYMGTPGIALFLAQLGAATRDERFAVLAREALAMLRARLRHTAAGLSFLGAFQGWGGLLYAFTRLADLWQDRKLRAEAAAILDRLPPLIETERDLDVITGSAGAIGGLLAEGSQKALEIAVLCGEHLLARAEPAGEGLGWRSRIEAELPQTGFSHGAAGIGWALWKLAEATGEGRFREAALGAFRYERGRYDAARNNWLDAGDGESGRPRQAGNEITAMAWCYGAPGVGLSRLDAASSGAPLVREDLELALTATLERGFGYNHCLCHGDLGNLDVLLLARKALHRPELDREIARRAWSVLASMDRHGFLSGTPVGIESPGLMNGLAGIGYGLLRLADPEGVPSVLALERAARSAAGR
jgi:type 2 lantibiotic biosynthesis protein LanM